MYFCVCCCIMTMMETGNAPVARQICEELNRLKYLILLQIFKRNIDDNLFKNKTRRNSIKYIFPIISKRKL